MTAFLRDRLKLSMQVEIIFSKTAIIVEKLAKVINKKNSPPHNSPPFMFIKILGRVIKIRLGPELTSTPKLKQAGKIIKPAAIATNVSKRQIFTPSDSRVFSLDIYEPKISIDAQPTLRVKNAWFIAEVITVLRSIRLKSGSR